MSSLIDSSSTITILHFNDVYNVNPRDRDPCGGAAKFAHAIKSYSHLNPMILFSGDIFSPSVCKWLLLARESRLATDFPPLEYSRFGEADNLKDFPSRGTEFSGVNLIEDPPGFDLKFVLLKIKEHTTMQKHENPFFFFFCKARFKELPILGTWLFHPVPQYSLSLNCWFNWLPWDYLVYILSTFICVDCQR